MFNDRQKAISTYQRILKVIPDSIVAKEKIKAARAWNPADTKKGKKK